MHSRRAFTLIELVIAVLVIGILSSVAGPKFAQSLNRMRVEQAANRIKADLQYARAYAITNSVSVTVQFSTANHNYELVGLKNLDRPSAAYIVELDDAPYNVRLSSASFNANTSVTFSVYGQPNNAGSIVVQLSGVSKTISISADSGKVSVL